jgi:hypothetical protein
MSSQTQSHPTPNHPQIQQFDDFLVKPEIEVSFFTVLFSMELVLML